MADRLVRIKRAVLAGRFEFSRKAAEEMDADDLTSLDVAESILNAVAIYKSIRSQSAYRGRRRETLHIIQSTNLVGVPIYTKGKLVVEAGIETYSSCPPSDRHDPRRESGLSMMLKTCPTCGSKRIRKVRRTVTRQSRGKPFTVPNLDFHECPVCGEQVYSPDAMAKIEECRPKRRKSAA